MRDACKMLLTVLLTLCLAVPWVRAQQSDSQQQSVPDAPSATKNPLANAPKARPAPKRPEPPPEQPSGSSSSSSSAITPGGDGAAPAPAAPTVTRTRPAGADNRDDLGFTIARNVNFVVVPVTVKDSSGRMVDGLVRRDFDVFEDGVRQDLQFFSSDSFPISAAVLLDTGMSNQALDKVKQTLSAMVGAFSQFDEVAVYTFSHTVEKLTDFRAADERLSMLLRGRMRPRTGRQGGVAYAGGPLNSPPSVNSKTIDPNAPIVPTVQQHESRVLNDAILTAANDLAKRARARRRILFVVSDGVEDGSRVSYQDVLKVLLSQGISVYAVAVNLPLYGTVQKFKIPGLPAGNILPKYANATGGEVLNEFGARGIEAAYARATEDARNQYTLGYTTRATAASNYRMIEVIVHRPGLKVIARDGYYPLPPQPQSQPPTSQ